MNDKNRALALRWFDDVWNRRLVGTIDELMAPDAVGYMEGAEVRGPDQFKQVHAAILTAFPDLRIEIEGAVVDGDNVVVRWHATGAHLGEGFGFPATQAPVAFRGMTWMVIVGGRIVKGWDAWNQGALVETLRVADAKRNVAS